MTKKRLPLDQDPAFRDLNIELPKWSDEDFEDWDAIDDWDTDDFESDDEDEIHDEDE